MIDFIPVGLVSLIPSTNASLLEGAFTLVQAELKEATAPLLQKAVPGLTDDLIARMKVSPLRQFDPQLIQEPLVYRLYEVMSSNL